MGADKSSNFFTLLSNPVCERCGCSFGRDKHYWALRKSSKRKPGPTVDGRRSYIVSVEMTCGHCDRWWNIRVLWMERYSVENQDKKMPPHDGLQILSHETAEEVAQRIIATKRGGSTGQTLPMAIGKMTESDAETTRRHIAEIRKMLV